MVLIIDIYFVKHTDCVSPARRNNMALKCFYTSAGHSLSSVLYWTREAEVYWTVMTEQVSFQRTALPAASLWLCDENLSGAV